MKQSYYEILEDGYELNYMTMNYILDLLTYYCEKKEKFCFIHLTEFGSGFIGVKGSDEIMFEFDNIEDLEQKLLDL